MALGGYCMWNGNTEKCLKEALTWLLCLQPGDFLFMWDDCISWLVFWSLMRFASQYLCEAFYTFGVSHLANIQYAFYTWPYSKRGCIYFTTLAFIHILSSLLIVCGTIVYPFPPYFSITTGSISFFLQMEKDETVSDSSPHIANIGRLVEVSTMGPSQL